MAGYGSKSSAKVLACQGNVNDGAKRTTAKNVSSDMSRECLGDAHSNVKRQARANGHRYNPPGGGMGKR